MMFHSIERLGGPFASVSEVGLAVPPAGEAHVANAEWKILFFLQADCVQEVQGAGTFRTQAGDIFVVPRRCWQRYRLERKGQSPHVHALKILFSLPAFPSLAEASARRASTGDPEADLTAFVKHHFNEFRHLPGAQTPAMRDIMRGIRREAEQIQPGVRHRVRALCTDLLVHTARRMHGMPASETETATGHGFVVNQAKEFLLRNFARELTLGDIAWHVKKSEEHLARVFRKVTGQTVFDYLRTIRIESAKTLLIDSDNTLTEIARRTGFSSLALFSRSFRQLVGQSASAYRASRALHTHGSRLSPL